MLDPPVPGVALPASVSAHQGSAGLAFGCPKQGPVSLDWWWSIHM